VLHVLALALQQKTKTFPHANRMLQSGMVYIVADEGNFGPIRENVGRYVPHLRYHN
jgi:hypothetical protein